MVNIIIALLHMDDLSLNLKNCSPSGSYPEPEARSAWERTDLTTYEGGNKMVISFTELVLDILHNNLPSAALEQEDVLAVGIPTGGRQAIEWRLASARHFIDDWEWRLSILQRLLPLSERQWRWKEALTVLRAAPSELLNL